MTTAQIAKTHNSKIAVKEVRDYEILVTGFDADNAFDRKVMDKVSKLTAKGYHINVA